MTRSSVAQPLSAPAPASGSLRAALRLAGTSAAATHQRRHRRLSSAVRSPNASSRAGAAQAAGARAAACRVVTRSARCPRTLASDPAPPRRPRRAGPASTSAPRRDGATLVRAAPTRCRWTARVHYRLYSGSQCTRGRAQLLRAQRSAGLSATLRPGPANCASLPARWRSR